MIEKIKIAIFCLLIFSFFAYYFADFTQNTYYKLNSRNNNYYQRNNKLINPGHKISVSNSNNNNNNKYNIIFAETNSKSESFSLRQLCAIESAALNNPLAAINVYSVKAKSFDHHQKWLNKYSNIKLIKLDFDDLFKETYFENWFKQNKKLIFKSPFTAVQLSDMARLVLLWKNGGYYSDLDTITIRSIEPLLNYGSGAGLQVDKPMDINNANLIFYKNHSFLSKWIPMSVESFNPNVWASNGKGPFKRIIESICNITLEKLHVVDLSSASKQHVNTSLCDFNIYPTKYFTPYNWVDWKILFEKNSKMDISKFLDAYSIHFYSTMSSATNVKFKDYSIYEFFAKNNCPIVYKDMISI